MLALIFLSVLINTSLSHPSNLAWYGGPVYLDRDGANPLTSSEHVENNVIATKAVSFNNNIYVITPRLRRKVSATVWLMHRGRRGPELESYPAPPVHIVGDCRAIQNAVDFHLDHLGILWVLDSGIVDSLEAPRCTCRPKVVVVSTVLRRVTRLLDLGACAQPASLLQNIAVQYSLAAKPFVYISDASRGVVIVHDTSSGAVWSVPMSAPAAGLQIALARRSPTHAVLVAVAVHHAGLIEIDTAALRRKSSASPLRVYGEQSQPVYLLGSASHHVYLRSAGGADALSWDARAPYNASTLAPLHVPAAGLVSTSLTQDPLTHTLLVLDSNYPDAVYSNLTAYQMITFIGHL